METIEETTTKTSSFVKHIFNFDAETKAEIMNLIQYSVLAIIPIILLNKLIQNYVPPADESKNSLEIAFEILLQLSVLLSAMFFINRVITFIPTYSGKDIGKVNLMNVVLGFLIIVLGLQTKLGEKVEILTNRVLDLVDGQSNKQPVQQQVKEEVVRESIPTHQPSQADNLARSMDIPPTQQPMSQPPVQNPGLHSQTFESSQTPKDFDDMYQEPLAANALGGGFSSW